jgi:hypothetical protein
MLDGYRMSAVAESWPRDIAFSPRNALVACARDVARELQNSARMLPERQDATVQKNGRHRCARS